MYTVYVLKDENGNIYKGMTKDLERRLKEHKNKHTKTTSKMKNIVVVYKENFDDFLSAREREIYFKSAAGRKFLKKVLPE
ncbi:GIY-YIG nuclease family protein [Candidatus Nomurabacteria bacterium]|nr:GIY-YIG nuclease family protein [Candidatus Nomurabacteria bacterium]MCB9820717.1 GIY-YIG nuclease family protein [Candidatus Nomurabacteria bacterium]